MNKRVVYLILCFFIAGCSPALLPNVPSAAQQSTAIESPTPSIVRKAVSPTLLAAVTPAPPEAQPTTVLTAVTVATLPAGDAGLIQTSGSLTVEILSSEDVDVSEPKYQISGKAPEGTVVSINDDIVVVDQRQVFSVSEQVDPGPNLIEIVASNAAGDEVSFMITVTYNPTQ